jgi:hypothetical protein
MNELYEEKKEFFEEKKSRKLKRYNELAAKKAEEAEAAHKRAHAIADAIPFGQPILVGHHSEKHHRSDLNKIHNLEGKGFELQKISEHYENKAANLVNPKGISSDDPDAIAKLKDKIASLEKDHAEWKALKPNPNAKSIFDKNSKHWRSLQLKSISAEIRRVKKRIAELEAVEQIDYSKEINEVKIYADKIENRLKVEFNGKPAPEIIQALKHAGFHWSPFNKVWQRMISNQAIYQAERIAGEVKQ